MSAVILTGRLQLQSGPQRPRRGGPASAAEVKPGTQIIKVVGSAVAGAMMRDREPHTKKNASDSLNLRVQRPNGEFWSLTLAAAVKAH